MHCYMTLISNIFKLMLTKMCVHCPLIRWLASYMVCMYFIVLPTRVCTIWGRAGGIGPAALVLAGPVFFLVKAKFHFCQKQVINKVLV